MAHPFSPDELARLQRAVAEAEGHTSAEIVPVIIAACDDYPEARWRGVAGGIAVVLLVTAVLYQAYDGWGLGWLHDGWAVMLGVVLGGLLGGVLAQTVPPLRRVLIGRDRMEARCHARAERAFLEEGVYKTREHTGVLIFVALFEHRVEVLADEGISARVAPEAWGDLCARLIAGVREGKLGEALAESFSRCGELLREGGFTRPDDDTNELPNHLRVYA